MLIMTKARARTSPALRSTRRMCCASTRCWPTASAASSSARAATSPGCASRAGTPTPSSPSLIGGGGIYARHPAGPFVWGGYYEHGTLIWHSRWVTDDAVIECREALALPGDAGSRGDPAPGHRASTATRARPRRARPARRLRRARRSRPAPRRRRELDGRARRRCTCAGPGRRDAAAARTAHGERALTLSSRSSGRSPRPRAGARRPTADARRPTPTALAGDRGRLARARSRARRTRSPAATRATPTPCSAG